MLARGSRLTDLHGVGAVVAARLLVEVGDITRFPDRNHFPSWNGSAPIDASSGDGVRHRLSRAGNRQVNRVLHTMAIVQLRTPTEGRDYYDRKKASGKGSMEAMRCLKRRLSDIVFRTMLADLAAASGTAREGNGRCPQARPTPRRRAASGVVGRQTAVVVPHPARLASQGASAGSAAQRKPVLPVELSAVFAVRAATR